MSKYSETKFEVLIHNYLFHISTVLYLIRVLIPALNTRLLENNLKYPCAI